MTPTNNVDLACAIPASEDAWQRQSTIEQAAAHAFFNTRARGGHSVAATVFGSVIEAAQTARAFFSEDRRTEVRDLLCDTIRAVMDDAGAGDGQ
jgi:hypothetical protein